MRHTTILAIVVLALTQSCADDGYEAPPGRDAVTPILNAATADSASTYWGGTAGVLALYADGTGHQSAVGGGIISFRWAQIDDDTIFIDFDASVVYWRVLRVRGGSFDQGWITLQEVGGEPSIPFVLMSGKL